MTHAAAPPSLTEILTLTRQELRVVQTADELRECGRAALALLRQDARAAMKFAYQKLHDVPYKDVKTCWRRLYVDASLGVVVGIVEGVLGRQSADQGDDRGGRKKAEEADWLDEVVGLLDKAIILAGAPGREELLELWFEALKGSLGVDEMGLRRWGEEGAADGEDGDGESIERPAKRRKLSNSRQRGCMPLRLPTELPDVVPQLRFPIQRVQEPSLSWFQKKLDHVDMHTPLIVEGAIEHWPAREERPWNNPEYLMEQTLGGRRLVPVEIGRSYTDDAWGQQIITFKEFMETYMLEPPSKNNHSQIQRSQENEEKNEIILNDDNKPKPSPTPPTGYLAQHDLFAQIPSLRADISIPDYCYSTPAPVSHPHIKPTATLDSPLLNAWFGPAGTVSPLHTDPYHNILAQVVGYKYVRLYAPSETAKLYPRGTEDGGVDMSNTSQIDLDEGMAVCGEVSCWAEDEDNSRLREQNGSLEERRREFEERYPIFQEAKYVEGILAPGECLYLPVGWWHYIRSLTPSFSVSFWFN